MMWDMPGQNAGHAGQNVDLLIVNEAACFLLIPGKEGIIPGKEEAILAT